METIGIRQFLETILPESNDGFVEIRALPPGGGKPWIEFFPTISSIYEGRERIEPLLGSHNIYYGVCPRSEKIGSKDAVKLVWSLWADMDGKNFQGGKEEALRRLNEFPLRPTAIVDSGYGYHLYWRLKEALELVNNNVRLRVEGLLKALANALLADEKVAEVARILRLPQTYNLKNPKESLHVEVIGFDANRQYNLYDFETLLESQNSKPFTAPAPKNPPGWVGETLKGLKDGNRNDSFTKVSGRLHSDGMTYDDIIEILKPHAQKTDFPDKELEHLVAGICKRYSQKLSPHERLIEEGTNKATKPTKADIILSLVASEEIELFHDHIGNPYAHIQLPVRRSIDLRTKAFKNWLVHLAWQKMSYTPSQEILKQVTQVLEAKACFEGEGVGLEVRVAWHNDTLYYDLGDGKAIRVTPGKWEVTKDFPKLFRKIPHQKPQVIPVAGGDLSLLLDLINLPPDGQDQGRRLLFLVWMVVSLVPGFPHPVLVVHGPQGSAKSSLFRFIKELLDPSMLQTLAPSDQLREFVLQADHHYFLSYDNLSWLPDWLSDALCRACTGDGFSKRELYSDLDEVVLNFRRVIALNGINQVIAKPDLLDRSFLLRLERIPEEKRKEETTLWKIFNDLKPKLLGAMFDALSKALGIVSEIKLTNLPRMADFTRWGASVAEAMGFTCDQFLVAYKTAIADQHREAITASPVAQAVISIMENRGFWEGTPSNLLEEINVTAINLKLDMKSKQWPKDPNWVWRRLTEAQANLQSVGINIEKSEAENRVITIRKNIENDG